MKAKNVNASNLTNAISLAYFQGGRISGEVRAEIIRSTCAEFQEKEKEPLKIISEWLKNIPTKF